ncbi:conjugal transfer protein TraG N-terminal domain-containing protein [Burkholderia plantarii]|uniref:conjugal transfer protein TraG N-terminal domain-containing protein n=1 Tax=Burkholderia plantarii TaxID=41899 RepID=UPI0006D8B7F2|nr:conjugal transfer protein TraG N-terminal domain-containing protein [Burkholderia plantarii]
MEIDTYGNVDTLYYVLNGVASFMGSGSFSGLMRFTLLSGLLIALVAAIGRKSTDIVKWFASAMLMTQLVVAPVENVFITDVTGIEPTREVDHVPAYLAAIAQASTTVSRSLTQAYETVFSVPDTLGLQKGDLGFGVSVLQKVNQAQVVDPGLQADLMQFFKECTVYDIQDGAINPQTIMSGTDPFNTVFTQTSPARYVTTNTLTASPTTDTCSATGTLLLIRVTDAEQNAEQIYGKEMYPDISDASAAKAAFVNAIGDSYGFILQSSQNASSALRQAMFNNVWRQAGAELPAMLNDPGRVAEVNALISSAQAGVAANGSMTTTMILAKEALPTYRNYIEAILYALFPIVLVLSLIGGGDAAKRTLGAYAKILLWIGLWPVIFAMLNGLSLIHLRSKMLAMSLQAGVPFGMAPKFSSTLLDEQALLGYMIVTTPVIAWGIINVASWSAERLASLATGAFTTPAQQIGGQQAQGDENIGNSHLDNSSVGNSTRNVISANKYDTSGLYRAGSVTVEQGTGSSFTNFANGLITRSDSQSSFGFGATAQSATERSLGTDTSTGISASRTSSTFAGSERVASTTNTVGNSSDRATTQRSSDDASSGTRGSQTEATDRRRAVEQQATDSYEHSTSGETNWRLGADARAGLGADKSFGEGNPANAETAGTPGQTSNGRAGTPTTRQSSTPAGAGSASTNSEVYDLQKEEDLVRRATALGKSPTEIEALRNGYRSKTRAAAAIAGEGEGRGGFGGKLGFDLDLGGGYAQRFVNSDTQRFADQRTSQEGETSSEQISREGSQTHSEATAEESGQHARNEQSASLTEQASSGMRDSADTSRSSDLRQRGSTQQVSRLEQTQNLLTPAHLRDVATRNGMSYSRMMTLPETQLRQLISDDSATREILRQNSAVPTRALNGGRLPTTERAVVSQGAGTPRSDVAASFERMATNVGSTDTTPVEINTLAPRVVRDAHDRVDAMESRIGNDAERPLTRVREKVDLPDAMQRLTEPENDAARALPARSDAYRAAARRESLENAGGGSRNAPNAGSQQVPGDVAHGMNPQKLSDADIKIVEVGQAEAPRGNVGEATAAAGAVVDRPPSAASHKVNASASPVVAAGSTDAMPPPERVGDSANLPIVDGAQRPSAFGGQESGKSPATSPSPQHNFQDQLKNGPGRPTGDQ